MCSRHIPGSCTDCGSEGPHIPAKCLARGLEIEAVQALALLLAPPLIHPNPLGEACSCSVVPQLPVTLFLSSTLRPSHTPIEGHTTSFCSSRSLRYIPATAPLFFHFVLPVLFASLSTAGTRASFLPFRLIWTRSPRRPASPFGCFPPASIRPRLLLPTITTWQALVANANCRTVVPLYPVYLSQALAVCLPFSR